MANPQTALNAILSNAWAITDDGLEVICAIATREHEYADGDLTALEARLGRKLNNENAVSVRGSTAIIALNGPMFRHANLMTQISGATSYARLAIDFQAAVDDPAITTIVLKMDTPGGEVAGVSQLAALVAGARSQKKIIAYVDGSMASAGYWVGSAAHKIIAADTAIVGSIGVQMGLRRQEPSEGEKAFLFISSQSPNKNLGPETESGAAAIQKTVNDLAQVFVDAVAENRGISASDVLKSYGQGGVFVAAEALERGMIDGIATFEQLLSEQNAMDYQAITAETLTAQRPDLVAQFGGIAAAREQEIRTEAATAERARQTALDDLMVPGAETLIATFKADGTSPEAAALAVVKHVKEQGKKGGRDHLKALADTESDMDPPAHVPAAETVSDDAILDAVISDARKTRALR